MGLRFAKILSFVRAFRNGANVTDVKVDRAGGDNRTPEHFADPGDDSFPLTTDYVATGNLEGDTRTVAIGYLDPINTPKATAGDKRIYARDAETGAVVVEVWLKSDGTATTENSNGSFTLAPDGTITGSNGGGSFQLQAGGDFVVNGAKITQAGEVVNAAGKVLGTHAHP